MKKFIASLLLKLSNKLNKDLDPTPVSVVETATQDSTKASEPLEIVQSKEPKLRKIKGPKPPALTPEEMGFCRIC